MKREPELFPPSNSASNADGDSSSSGVKNQNDRGKAEVDENLNNTGSTKTPGTSGKKGKKQLSPVPAEGGAKPHHREQRKEGSESTDKVCER